MPDFLSGTFNINIFGYNKDIWIFFYKIVFRTLSSTVQKIVYWECNWRRDRDICKDGIGRTCKVVETWQCF